MSADGGAAQPSAAGEKSQAPALVSTFGSAVINKSTRKFAPKAIPRRRPAAAPASEPSSATPELATAPSAHVQTPQPSTQRDSPSAAPGGQPAPLTIPQELSAAPTQPAGIPADLPPLPTADTTPSGAGPPQAPIAVTDADQDQASCNGVSRKRPARVAGMEHEDTDETVFSRPEKRLRPDLPEPSPDRPSAVTVQSHTRDTRPTTTQRVTREPSAPSRPSDQEAAAPPATAAATTPTPTQPSPNHVPLPTPTPSAIAVAQSGKSALPSPAPTTSQEESSAAPTPSIETLDTGIPGPTSPITDTIEQTTRSKKKRKLSGTQFPQTAKAGGKRKAADASPYEDGEEIVPGPVAKKPRKVRKDKGTKRKAPTTEEAGEAEVTEEPRPKLKRARKKRRTTTAEPEGEEQEGRQRGRRKRAPTPEDAEEKEFALDTTMASLAVNDPRQGRLSTREKQMREIDWDEVKKRRQERAFEIAQNGGAHSTEVDERLQAAANERNAANEVPQLVADEFGIFTINADSLVRDRRAEATQDEDTLVAIEEDDLTNNFNMASHLLSNRRDPADRVRVAPRKWTMEETDAFYNALTIFGTDFGMVATLFPNKSRRSIKQKFVREERDDPERIKQAVLGRKEPIKFEEYLEMTGREASSFKDPRELEAELKEIEDANQAEIETAKKEYAELQRQKVLAGVDSSGEDGDEGGKENTEKSKTKKKRKERPKKKLKGQPIGGEEVEILETIDD